MSVWRCLVARVFRLMLACYPAEFQTEFSDEMELVVWTAIEDTKKRNTLKLVKFFCREIRDWPGSIWREHLRGRKGQIMDQNNFAWRPLNPKELMVGITFFIAPILGDLGKLIFGYSIGNRIGSILLIASLVFTLVILILGFIQGFPRWTIPYLGAVVIGIATVQAVFPIWGLFADHVKMMIRYYTKTLTARIQYSALLNGFFWLIPFLTLVLIILLLMVWPRTRSLAKQIRQDWTLLSFMIFSSIVFGLELIFEEYAYDEAWKIVCRVCLTLGAWIYFKTANQRKRILTLLAGVTLTYWIAAIGKWIVLPLQSWGSWYGYDHWTYRRFELGSTLAGWFWAVFFMLIPALMRLIPPRQQNSTLPENMANSP